ncbi:unnamed protein product [Merluccius merluccius]
MTQDSQEYRSEGRLYTLTPSAARSFHERRRAHSSVPPPTTPTANATPTATTTATTTPTAATYPTTAATTTPTATPTAPAAPTPTTATATATPTTPTPTYPTAAAATAPTTTAATTATLHSQYSLHFMALISTEMHIFPSREALLNIVCPLMRRRPEMSPKRARRLNMEASVGRRRRRRRM